MIKNLCSIVFLILMLEICTAQEPPKKEGPPMPEEMPADVMLKLLNMTEVQDEIDLAPFQLDDLRKRGEAIKKEIELKLREEIDTALKEVLSSQQVARLKQISVRAMGPDALTQPSVMEQLKLTTHQQKKIQSIRQSAALNLDETKHLFKGKEGELYRFAAEVEIRDAAKREILGVLDFQQQRKFQELMGKDFDVSQLHLRKGPPPKRPQDKDEK